MTDVTRRRFIHTGSMALAAAMASQIVAAAGATADKTKGKLPNILWFVSEDNYPVIGAYGDKLAVTPTIDKLCREGIRYDRAYCTSPVCGPSRFSIVTGMYTESSGSAMEHGSTNEELPTEVEGYPAVMRRAGYYCTNNAKKNYNSQLDFVDMWDESSNKAHWKNRPAGQPFLAVFNTFTTHESALFNPLSGKVKPEQVRIPAYLPDTPGVRKDFATFYNAMEKMDGELAAHLEELERAGVADDTIIFYYSDNGGITPRGKRYCYELGTRCALVVYIPPKWAHLSPHKPGTVVREPVSFVDLAPTLLSLVDIKPPKHMHGHALLGKHAVAPAKYVFSERGRMDESYDLIRSVTDGRYRYIRNYAPHRIWGQHNAFEFQAASYQDWEAAHRAGTLNEVQDRFWRTKPYEELYDAVADADCVVNLADQPAHRPKLDELRAALDKHMIEVNDNGLIPEGSTLQGYIRSRAPGAYPLRAIMALAAKAANRNVSNLAQFRVQLGNTHECMRYWAAQGMLILGSQAMPALQDIRAAFHREQSVPVRIALAEVLINLDNDREALRALGTILDADSRGPFRLQAINALTYVGDRAKPVLPAIKRSADEDHRHVRSAAQYLVQVLEGTYNPIRQEEKPGGYNPLDPEYGGLTPSRPYD